MIRNKTSFDVQCGDRLYVFICEMDSPAQDVKTVLDFMSKKVQEIIDSAEKKEDDNSDDIEIIEGE